MRRTAAAPGQLALFAAELACVAAPALPIVAPEPAPVRVAPEPAPGTLPIVLVACSDTKRATNGVPVCAADLYTSPLFRKSMAYARHATTEDRIRILSAKHGVIRTDHPVATYDVKMGGLDPHDRAAWASQARGALLVAFPHTPVDVIILAGSEYVDALRPLGDQEAPGAPPWTLTMLFGDKPGARMSIGERLRWLNDHERERTACAEVTEAPPANDLACPPVPDLGKSRPNRPPEHCEHGRPNGTPCPECDFAQGPTPAPPPVAPKPAKAPRAPKRAKAPAKDPGTPVTRVRVPTTKRAKTRPPTPRIDP